jgi:hypothetical protein
MTAKASPAIAPLNARFFRREGSGIESPLNGETGAAGEPLEDSPAAGFGMGGCFDVEISLNPEGPFTGGDGSGIFGATALRRSIKSRAWENTFVPSSMPRFRRRLPSSLRLAKGVE